MTEVEHLLLEAGLTVTATSGRGRPTFTITNQAGMAWTYPYPDALDLLTDGDIFDLTEADAILTWALTTEAAAA